MERNDTEIGVRLATEEDRTYLTRLFFLTTTFGDEHAPLPDYHPGDLEPYVDDWSPRVDGGVIAVSNYRVPAGGSWLRYFTTQRKGDAFLGNPEADPNDRSQWATEFDPETIPELCIAVERRYAGLGVGRQLLRNVCDLAKEQQAPGIALWVNKDNARAAKLYTAEGFEPIEVPGQKPGQMVKFF